MMERRPARAERSIGHELEGAHLDPAVADRLGSVLPVARPRLRLAARHRHVVAKGELAALDEAAIGGKGAQIGAHFVEAGEPRGETLGDGLAHRLVEARLVGRRLHLGDEPLRGIHEETGGLAARVARDRAAGGIGRVSVDPRRAERG
jgi:hypothetical protein